MLIYLVEDDNSIRELVAVRCTKGFEAEGFERPSAFGAPVPKDTFGFA